MSLRSFLSSSSLSTSPPASQDRTPRSCAVVFVLPKDNPLRTYRCAGRHSQRLACSCWTNEIGPTPACWSDVTVFPGHISLRLIHCRLSSCWSNPVCFRSIPDHLFQVLCSLLTPVFTWDPIGPGNILGIIQEYPLCFDRDPDGPWTILCLPIEFQ